MLFRPARIGKCEIKNRIAMAPMLMGFGKLDGTVTDKMLDYYEERAKGGAGLIFTGVTRVNDQTGSIAFAQLAASHDYHIESLKQLADRIHPHGAKVFVQLHHPGRQNIGLLVGTIPLSIRINRVWKGYPRLLYSIAPTVGKFLIKRDLVPSSVAPSRVEPSYFAGGRVRALRYKEIKVLIQQFIDGAERVLKSGCDGIALHAAHGYLIQQFLSPHTNKRNDEYGGSLENRMRFLLEIIRGIRERCEEFPIVVRLTVDECYAKIGKSGVGYGLDEGVKMAQVLEEEGVDAIDVSSAGYDTFNYWLEPMTFELGWRKHMARAVKAKVKIPVIAANLIRSPEQAEQQLRDGIQDIISLGRPHIADPYWTEKVRYGKEKEIKRCINCLYCIESMLENAYVGGHSECAVNPHVGKEKIEPARDGNGRKVVVVGAGPAGLTAAEILSKRGFGVTVFERESRPGGQVAIAAGNESKSRIAWSIEDLVYSVEKGGVEIKYNTEASPDEIKKLEADAVIIATGGEPIIPGSIEGAQNDNVCAATDFYGGKEKLTGERVAVIGSGMTGLETAVMLARWGNEVTVVEMADTLAPGTWMQHVDDIRPELEKHNIAVLLNHKLVKVKRSEIILEHNRQVITLEADKVILSMGVRSNRALYDEIKDELDNVYVIGDAARVGRIADATRRATEIAMKI